MSVLIIISGPTAVGKTSIAIKLAELFNTQIVSADSRQVYKEMPIGTAHPTKLEMKNIKHHLIDFLDVTENYNAYKFEIDALNVINEIFKKNRYAILVGGTGLYINSICNGLFSECNLSDAIKYFLRKKSESNCKLNLLNDLKHLDFEYYNLVDKNNFRRIVRALEIIYSTGKSYTSFVKKDKIKRNFEIIQIGLERPRDELYDRINIRVDQMIEMGLINEAEKLYDFRHYQSLQTIGYKEVFQFLDKKINLDTTIKAIKTNSRHYAKRQLTWFNKKKEINWISANTNDSLEKIYNIIEIYQKNLSKNLSVYL